LELDAAIRIFDPAYNVEAIKPKAPTAPHGVSFRGEFVRVILNMMREAKGPVTTKEVALHVMRQRGLNTADVAALVLISLRTRALLYHYQERSVVRAVRGNEEGRRRFNCGKSYNNLLHQCHGVASKVVRAVRGRRTSRCAPVDWRHSRQ
jgi:hypothetical protein